MKLITYLSFFISFSCYAQTITTDRPGQQKPFIEVLGTASQEVKPDRIDLSIMLSEKSNDISENSLERQEQSLKTIISEMSIPNGQLTLADIASEIIKDKRKDQTVQRTKEYYLRLSSADQVSLVLKKLADANIKEVKVTSVDNSKIDSLRKAVRIVAIKAAKDKAIYLTTAIGEKIDQALEIHEEPSDQLYLRYVQTNLANSNLGNTENEPDQGGRNFRTFNIKFTYYIKYSLKQ